MASRLLFELFERRAKKGGKFMGPQIPTALESQNRLSDIIPSIEIAQPSRWSFGIGLFLSFLFLVGFAWMRPEFNREEIPDWRPVLARAEASLEKRELYDARSFYSRAARLASWREDWGGLLAAACGMKMLDHESGPYSNVHTILVRAMMAAESRESRAGIAAVARAFAAMGQDKAASMVLGRIQTDWPEKIQDATNVHMGSCW
jgi:hypothetical protein